MTLREFFDRYGPTAAVLTVLTLLIVLLPGNAKDETTLSTGSDNGSFQSTSDTTGSGDAGQGAVAGDTGTAATGGTSAAGSGGSVLRTGQTATGSTTGGGTSGGGSTGTESAAPAGGVEFGKGPNCRPDNRQKGIAFSMPPCANWTPGTPNGGATSRGVTADKIVVTRFISQVDPATRAALQGAGATDSPEDTARMVESLRRYYNFHYETYGREVVIVNVDASGEDDNDEAMRSDAVRIADEYKAFANVNGPAVLAQELAARGVPCLCTVSLSSQFYLDNPPLIFSDLPTGEEYFSHVAEYMEKRLVNRPAKWAGTADLQVQNRKIGLVYFEGSGKANPYYQVSHKFFLEELKKRGLELVADVGYVFEAQRAPDQSTSIIAKMKSAGATTIIFAGDPLMPIFLTKEATRQTYFPEWMMTGTALTDTTFFGRTYDTGQWRHAFGISPLFVFWVAVSNSPGYREYYHGMPDEPQGRQPPREGISINVVRSPWNLLFRGLHMAGPNLTPENFSKGFFNYPRTGGTPANPLYYYTREHPTSYKDFTEVWWNPNGAGIDETSKPGAGTLMKANQGARYELGKWPSGPPAVFTDDPSPVYTNDNPPGGRDATHEQDGHRHPYDKQGCLSCKPK